MKVEIIKKTVFVFNGVAGSTQTIWLANHIRTEHIVSGTLNVRLVFKNGWSTTATPQVGVINTQIPEEEPGVFYDAASDLATITIPNGDSAPMLYTAPISGFGTHVKVALRWIQGTTAGAGNQTVTIGVDLALREA